MSLPRRSKVLITCVSSSQAVLFWITTNVSLVLAMVYSPSEDHQLSQATTKKQDKKHQSVFEFAATPNSPLPRFSKPRMTTKKSNLNIRHNHQANSHSSIIYAHAQAHTLERAAIYLLSFFFVTLLLLKPPPTTLFFFCVGGAFVFIVPTHNTLPLLLFSHVQSCLVRSKQQNKNLKHYCKLPFKKCAFQLLTTK